MQKTKTNINEIITNLITASTSGLAGWRHHFRRSRPVVVSADEEVVGAVDHVAALGTEAVLLQVTVQRRSKQVEVDQNDLFLKNKQLGNIW